MALGSFARSLRGCLVGYIAVVSGFGCSAGRREEPQQHCAVDAECPSEQRCSLTGTAREPVVFNPCVNVVGCSSDASCPTDQVCAPYMGLAQSPFCPARVCSLRCRPDSCPQGQVCKESGLCELEDCDKQGAPACPAHYECDPAAAGARLRPLAGSNVSDGTDPVREAARGCVRKQCDDPDGFTCRERWSCAPDEATDEASGCVPDPCSTTGLCSYDASYICEPANDGPRPQGTDPQGCVIRNCGEGFLCQYLREGTNYAYCDLESAESDDYGCRIRRCDEGSVTCPQGYGCDRGSTASDRVGCRLLNCNEPGGRACGAGTSCAPVTPGNDVYSCHSDPVANGGSSGGGGAVGSASPGGSSPGGATASGGSGGAKSGAGGLGSGGAGETTGGSAVAGSAPQPGRPAGVCVDR